MRGTNKAACKTRPITILSLNVGRGAHNHEIIMNEAYLSEIDIILIQEPYIFRDRSRRITKHHPAYSSFSPNLDWVTNRPRVISYLRKRSGLRCTQISTPSSDIIILHLKSPTGKSLNVFNIYNAPYSQTATLATHTLYSLPPSLLRGSCLLQGDLNLHHTHWQASWPHCPTPGAEEFLKWAEDNNLSLLSPQNKATHNRGNVLDLALGSGALLRHTRCCIASHLDATSDHLPLLTTVDCCEFPKPKPKLRADTLDVPLYRNLLEISLNDITSVSINPTKESLDKSAEDIIEAIWKAYSGAARRSSGSGKGK